MTKDNLKLNKNILLTFSILIILAILFTPTLKDLTGKLTFVDEDWEEETQEYIDWTATGGTPSRNRYVDIKGISSDFVIKTIDITKTLKRSIDRDNILIYDGKAYALTEEGSIYRIGLFYYPNFGETTLSRVYGLKDFEIDNDNNIACGSISDSYWASLKCVDDIKSLGGLKNLSLAYTTPNTFQGGGVGLPPVFKNDYIFAPSTWQGNRKDYSWWWSPRIYVHNTDASFEKVDDIKVGITAIRGAGPQAYPKAISSVEGNDQIVTLVPYGNIMLVTDVTSFTTEIKDAGCAAIKTELASQGKYVYYICDNAQLRKFDSEAGTNEELATISNFNNKKAFAISPTHIYAGKNNGYITYMDHDASSIQQEKVSNVAITSLVAVEDIVYASDIAGTIYALDPETLEEIWSAQLPEIIDDLIIPSTTSLLAIADNNKLFLIIGSESVGTPDAEEPPEENIVNIVSTLYGPDDGYYYDFVVYDSDTLSINVKTLTGSALSISDTGYTESRLSRAEVPVDTEIRVGFKNDEFSGTGNTCVDFVAYRSGSEIDRTNDCITDSNGWWKEYFVSDTEKTVVFKLEDLRNMVHQPIVHESGVNYELNSSNSRTVEVSWFEPRDGCPSDSESICMEAEDLIINDFDLLIDKTASEGILLTTFSGENPGCTIDPNSPSITETFDVPEDEDYYLQVRTIAPDANSNSLCIQIDSGPVESWILPTSSGLSWNTNPYVYALDENTHEITIYPKEIGVGIDAIRFTQSLCDQDSDCDTGEICNSGVCVPLELLINLVSEVCDDNQDNDGDSYIDCNDIDCAGQTCDTNRLCYLGSCIAPECEDDDECNSDEICDTDYTCLQVDCKIDSDCDADEICDTDYTCLQVDCKVDDDCEDDEECDDNECETIGDDDCNSDSDCPSGEVCTSGICEYADCDEHWECAEWSTCFGSQQTRTCSDVNSCGTTNYQPAEVRVCTASLAGQATCDDGIRNQNEDGVDCGGPCFNICNSCNDNEENCHSGACETAIDCGGPCVPCEIVAAGKSGTFWFIFITIILILIVLVVGLWYFKLKKGAEGVGKSVDKFSRGPPPSYPGIPQRRRPPVQPSSLIRI